MRTTKSRKLFGHRQNSKHTIQKNWMGSRMRTCSIASELGSRAPACDVSRELLRSPRCFVGPPLLLEIGADGDFDAFKSNPCRMLVAGKVSTSVPLRESVERREWLSSESRLGGELALSRSKEEPPVVSGELAVGTLCPKLSRLRREFCGTAVGTALLLETLVGFITKVTMPSLIVAVIRAAGPAASVYLLRDSDNNVAISRRWCL